MPPVVYDKFRQSKSNAKDRRRTDTRTKFRPSGSAPGVENIRIDRNKCLFYSKFKRLTDITMDYYFTRQIDKPFDETLAEVKKVLPTFGFGIVSEIDVTAKISGALQVPFRPYYIIGACKPAFAYQAILIEDKIGIMLPCNVVIQDQTNGLTEVSVVNPLAAMMAINNPSLQQIAKLIADDLQKALSALFTITGSK